MRPKVNTSGELINILAKHGYVSREKLTGFPILHLTRLQKEQTIQSVAAWMTRGAVDSFSYMPAADALLGELRNHIEHAGLPPLKDQADTQEEYDRTKGFMGFLKKREKPKAYPAGTVLDARGNPVR